MPTTRSTGADALVILTEWDQFRALDLDRLKAALKTPVVVDLRNIYRPDEMAQGFRYASIGRPQRAGAEIGEAVFAQEAAAKRRRRVR